MKKLSLPLLLVFCLFLPACAERASVNSSSLNTSAVTLSCATSTGREYQVGEGWKCEDGCNTCWCELTQIGGQTYASISHTQMMCYSP